MYLNRSSSLHFFFTCVLNNKEKIDRSTILDFNDNMEARWFKTQVLS